MKILRIARLGAIFTVPNKKNCINTELTPNQAGSIEKIV